MANGGNFGYGTYEYYSYSVQADGTVQTWGGPYLLPVSIPGLTGVVLTNSGYFVKNDGTVWSLANGSATSGLVQFGISNVQKISTSGSHALALKSDGTVWGWGDNQVGELGIGQFTYTQSSPVQAIGLTGIVDIAASNSNSSEISSYAVMNNGTVWAWGNNYSGQFGNGATCGVMFCGISTPTQIFGLSGVKAIASGSNHTVILKNDGSVWVAGGTNGLSFIKVAGLNNITAIAAGGSSQGGGDYSLALKNDGTAWLFQNSPSPVASQINGLSNIQSIQIGLGGFVFYAVGQNGTVYDWGNVSANGLLGNGTLKGSASPVSVGVAYVSPPPPYTSTTVPALSEFGIMIMGALLLLISFVIQKEKDSHLR